MSRESISIPRNPPLSPAQDYYELRREGVGFIEQMASARWTDYNLHDPGITILEALCYALTEIGYRCSWHIKDLLTSGSTVDPLNPYPEQAFFTAREILTVNPVTPNDFRRLLMGLMPVRNAWILCKRCACDVHYYAWCDEGRLTLNFQKPGDPQLMARKIEPQGLYEVRIELRDDADSGDLNDRRITRATQITDGSEIRHPLRIELRFPDMSLARPTEWQQFLDSDGQFTVSLISLGATRDYNILADALLDEAGKDAYLRTHWNETFYATLEASLSGGTDTLLIEHAAIHFFGSHAARRNATAAGLASLLVDPGDMGFVRPYWDKARKTAAAILQASNLLSRHRNLDEDYCSIRTIDIEDVAVCMDIEVSNDADIEWVQASAWLAIEQYFNPPVPHYGLQEMQARHVPVENIFNGPVSDVGFISDDDLDASGLKSVLYVSDIINLLMDIDGVLAVNNVLLSKYDEQGNQTKGSADPQTVDGVPVFDPDKSSAQWALHISPLHAPRLYSERSRFLFQKSGLPFLARADEAADILLQLRGAAEKPKVPNAAGDLPAPVGINRDPQAYYPVQYSLPPVYGIAPAGLSSNASSMRKGQARQLQAYLMVFEQLLANACAQLAHARDCFSLDPAVVNTYFTRLMDASVIKDYDAVVAGLTGAKLQQLVESPQEFLDRRNRFLDHLLARFGESVDDHALMLNRLLGEKQGRLRLIEDKIFLLKAYPLLSRNRGKAFDVRHTPCAPDNTSGLLKRVGLLLGLPDLHFEWTVDTGGAITHFTLLDAAHRPQFSGQFPLPVSASTPEAAQQSAFDIVIVRLSQPASYAIDKVDDTYRLRLLDQDGNPLGEAPTPFDSQERALAARTELVNWSSHARSLIIEHLLLRPKFPGDALFLACADGACELCDAADPYSFRLTMAMPGWTDAFNTDMDLRTFAERTIQLETPAHLLPKVCWIGNDGFVDDPCDPVIVRLAEWLETEGLSAGGTRPTRKDACACAGSLYAAYAAVFKSWYEDKTLDYHQSDTLTRSLESLFQDAPDPGTVPCKVVLDTPLLEGVRTLMVGHFHTIVLKGWQFERLENAWCRWLEANAHFDWPSERLQDKVTAILEAGLIGTGAQARLCACAASILTDYGMAFSAWLDTVMTAGNVPDDFSTFTPGPIVLCDGMTFATDTAGRIAALLNDRYAAYTDVSYRLRILVDLLGRLSSVYPAATLHDCDEGSDFNPVRLGQTALGSHRPGAGSV